MSDDYEIKPEVIEVKQEIINETFDPIDPLTFVEVTSPVNENKNYQIVLSNELSFMDENLEQRKHKCKDCGLVLDSTTHWSIHQVKFHSKLPEHEKSKIIEKLLIPKPKPPKPKIQQPAPVSNLVNPQTCLKCGEKFLNAGQLVRHHRAFYKKGGICGRLYKCILCEEKFESQEDFKNHTMSAHKCHKCNVNFASTLEQQKHKCATEIELD